jgi:phosphoribosylanthranilate isomerase
MALLVKICGINTAEAADAAVRAGADFVGLVFHPKSPRHLSAEAGKALADRLRGRVRLVALVADGDDETIAAVVNAVRPEFLQLHGRETPDRAGAIRSRFGVPVIKAVAIAEASDFDALPAYYPTADMLLLDAKAPEGLRAGGHGVAFDWQLLANRKISRPWFLAGGLNPENVARAVATAAPPGVDVSSGVETAPGLKSPERIAAFVSAARNLMEAR